MNLIKWFSSSLAVSELECVNVRPQNERGDRKMARAKLSKKQKVLNLLNKGQPVFWKNLR